MDLLFSATAVSTDLVFGASDVVTRPDAVIACNAALSGLSGYVSIARAIQVALVATLPSLGGVVDVTYASGTDRPTVGEVHGVAQVARRTEAGWQQPEQHATATVTGTQCRFTKAAGVALVVSMGFTESNRVKIGAANAFAESTQLEARRLQSSAQNASPHARISRSSRFANATRAPLARLDGRFQDGLRDRRLQVRGGWQIGARFLLGHQDHAGPAAPSAIQRGGRFQEAKRPPAGMSVVVVVPVHGQCTPSPHLLFWDTLFGSHLVFGRTPRTPLPVVAFFILPARFYMTTHNVFAQRLPDLASVPIYDATVSADAGSYCWTLQLTGPASLFELLAPVAGLPAQIRVTMDGIPWVFAVDGMQRSSAFGKTGVSVTGRSVTALIGAPYLRAVTRDNVGADRLAQQLALDALQYSGVDLDWGLTDWLVPAGAWSHNGTPLDAVQAIAQAAGGYLQSHRSAATLLTRHPYSQRTGDNPGAPWGWMTGPADVDLAPDAIITDGVERRDGPDINAVYVSGTTQGVLARVKRTSTAGDKLSAMVTDALITHADAARQRGLAVLGAAGSKYNVRLELPVLTGASQPGVLEVGQLVQVNAASPWRGRVRAVSAAYKRPTLRQTVTLERHLETV
jgi:hypothetical protein